MNKSRDVGCRPDNDGEKIRKLPTIDGTDGRGQLGSGCAGREGDVAILRRKVVNLGSHALIPGVGPQPQLSPPGPEAGFQAQSTGGLGPSMSRCHQGDPGAAEEPGRRDLG